MRGPLKAMLATLESVLDGPGFDPATCTRRFAIAGSDYLADHMLAPLVDAVHARAPGARIDFHLWEPGYYRLLSDEGVDLVATIADLLPDNLHGRAMGEDRAVCVMRAGHPLARQTLTLADYVGHPHLRITGGSDKDGVIEQALARQGLRRDIKLSVPFFSAALRIVAAHDVLLTIPEHIAIQLAAQAPIVWRPLPFEIPAYRYWLLWHARNQQVLDVLHQSTQGVSRFNAD
jgi:DNA-binding transcriptional LysR family regulator